MFDLNFLGFLLLVYLFAWAARGVLGARELTWGRTFFAAVVGLIFGITLSAFILIEDFDSVDNVDPAQVEALALPLALIGTMGALVVLEMLFISRTKKRRGFHPPRPIRSLRRWLGIWARGFQVTRILVRNGLGSAIGLRRSRRSGVGSAAELARRARISLEEAGGMFVKLGQLLVTRPDLLPPEALEELGRLHADVAPIHEEDVRAVIETETGSPVEETFSEFDWVPLGSASIGQAHTARLADGREVVVKVRRPGLEVQVERDLAILWWLAGLVERRTEWGESYGVRDVIADFSEALREELDFRIEGRHASEAGAAVARYPHIRVPEIIDCTEKMVVMERMIGTPLSKLTPADIAAANSRPLADALCESQVKAMLDGGRFHGDPHQGNVLLLHDGDLGLVDFGITDRLDAFERAAVFEMLVALRLEDPIVLFDALVTIGAVGPDQDPEEVERSLAVFLAAHMTSGLPRPEALTDLLRLANKMGMRLPASTTTMFRALATLTGTLETLSPGYPLLDTVASIGGGELRERVSPQSIGQFVQQEWAELGPVFRRAPRHLDRIATLLQHGGLTGRIRLFSDEEEIRVVERLLNRAVISFISIGLGAVSVVLLISGGGPLLTGGTVTLFDVLGWSGLTLAVILLLRVLLEVFRSD